MQSNKREAAMRASKVGLVSVTRVTKVRLVLIMKKREVAAKLGIILIAKIVNVLKAEERAREEHYVVGQEMRQMILNLE